MHRKWPMTLGQSAAAEVHEGARMLDRFLAATLKLVVTALIAGIGGVCVMTAYTGFMHLVRIHVAQAAWLLGVALLCGVAAYVLATRRGDLADC
jgi:hypothetical protein